MSTEPSPPPQPTTIELEFLEFPTPEEAVRHAESAGGVAILLGGRPLVTRLQDVEWMASFGSVFSYLVRRAGQVVAEPVNG